MQAETQTTELITLTEAAKIAPGRPSTNAMWRWCRRGVLSRGGERVRLRHVRVGGQLFTRLEWLEEFGAKLAEADARYFDLADAAVEAARATDPIQPRRRRRANSPAAHERRREEREAIDRELSAEGL